MAKAMAVGKATATINGEPTDSVTVAEPEVAEKPRMVDDRTHKERLNDIREANKDMLSTHVSQIENGKPFAMSPRVITDQAFLLDHIAILERKVRTYEKKLEIEESTA